MEANDSKVSVIASQASSVVNISLWLKGLQNDACLVEASPKRHFGAKTTSRAVQAAI
jgi:hypothetical protein